MSGLQMKMYSWAWEIILTMVEVEEVVLCARINRQFRKLLQNNHFWIKVKRIRWPLQTSREGGTTTTTAYEQFRQTYEISSVCRYSGYCRYFGTKQTRHYCTLHSPTCLLRGYWHVGKTVDDILASFAFVAPLVCFSSSSSSS